MFDTATGRMVPVRAIVIEGEKITAVVPAGEKFVPPAGAQVLAAEGKYLIPGLIDGHVHLVHVLNSLQITAEGILPVFFANGVYTPGCWGGLIRGPEI